MARSQSAGPGPQSTVRTPSRARLACQPCRCSAQVPQYEEPNSQITRRTAVLTAAATVVAAGLQQSQEAQALGNPFAKELKPRRRGFTNQIPLEDFTEGPEGLKYYDIVKGGGQQPKQGDRVAVHYEARWHGVTFLTSRQGMGVTGGSPIGFDVGAKGAGGTLPGLDLMVRTMRVGGQRKAIVPPQLAYGEKGIGEIPPNAELEMDVELLSIKPKNAFGTRVKVVEG